MRLIILGIINLLNRSGHAKLFIYKWDKEIIYEKKVKKIFKKKNKKKSIVYKWHLITLYFIEKKKTDIFITVSEFGNILSYV